MPQGPIPTAPLGQDPTGLFKPMQVDSSGKLIVVSDTGGDAVKLNAGAVAAGAYVAGSILDGADVAQGAKADAAVLSPALSASQIALLKGLLTRASPAYETVAASQTDQVMGGVGAAGDFFDHLVIVPATTSPGAVSIKDGAGSAITVFTGGTTSVTDLTPFSVPLLSVSQAGAWKVTTGANVSAIGVGNFSA